MRVRTYCFPGCFTRPPGHLDSQPSPRADHVEAKSPPGGNAHESCTRSRSAACRCNGSPRSGATSLRDTTTTRTALSSLFAPAIAEGPWSSIRQHRIRIAQAPERLRAAHRPQFLAGGSRSQPREAERSPVPGSGTDSVESVLSEVLHQRHMCSLPKASVDRLEQKPHNSLKPGLRVQPLSTPAHWESRKAPRLRGFLWAGPAIGTCRSSRYAVGISTLANPSMRPPPSRCPRPALDVRCARWRRSTRTSGQI